MDTFKLRKTKWRKQAYAVDAGKFLVLKIYEHKQKNNLIKQMHVD